MVVVGKDTLDGQGVCPAEMNLIKLSQFLDFVSEINNTSELDYDGLCQAYLC